MLHDCQLSKSEGPLKKIRRLELPLMGNIDSLQEPGII